MLDVFLTVDVEIWSHYWRDVDANFPANFRRYVYGPTARGDYALPFLLRQLNDHGLEGVFFVEPLFSVRCGRQALSDIAGLINDAGQEIQLHAHTEWIDQAGERILAEPGHQRRYFHEYTPAEQVRIIAVAKELLTAASGNPVTAFRAGSFGMDRDTLRAVAANGITFDASYNASQSVVANRQFPGAPFFGPTELYGVVEYPMTVFRDATWRLRHAQIGACTTEELESLLWQAVEAEQKAFVILTHNFETLNKAKNRADEIVVERTRWLCAFLDRHRDAFRTRGFREGGLNPDGHHARPLRSTALQTGRRFAEQFGRRRFD